MALERKYKLDWNDIADLFSALNTERVEFEYKALSYPNPNSKKRTKTSESVVALVNGINDMLSHDDVAEQLPSLSIKDIDIPQPKDLMKPDVFNKIKSKIEKLQTVEFGFNGSFDPCFSSDCFTDDNCFGHSSGWDFFTNSGEGSGCNWEGSGTCSGTVTWNSSH